MTIMNQVKRGMTMAYQRNYTLRMNIVYKWMVKQENNAVLWGCIYKTEHTARLYRTVFI